MPSCNLGKFLQSLDWDWDLPMAEFWLAKSEHDPSVASMDILGSALDLVIFGRSKPRSCNTWIISVLSVCLVLCVMNQCCFATDSKWCSRPCPVHTRWCLWTYTQTSTSVNWTRTTAPLTIGGKTALVHLSVFHAMWGTVRMNGVLRARLIFVKAGQCWVSTSLGGALLDVMWWCGGVMWWDVMMWCYSSSSSSGWGAATRCDVMMWWRDVMGCDDVVL